MPAIVGHYVDQIMSTELRPIGNMPRGVAHLLYDAVRAKSDAPLSTAMARALVDRVQHGDKAVIVCGAGGAPSLPTGEIDGLLGAVAIARALTLGLGADVHLAVEPRFVTPLTAIARAGELNVRDDPDSGWAGSIAIHVSPEDDDEGIRFAEDLLDRVRPRALLAIEKLSVNHQGVIHGATGIPWHEVHYNAERLFALAAARGILTCGIGDAGNEVGFGSIPEVATIQPHGDVMASAVSVDVLLAAAISDWGGYAVTAMMAFLLERPDLIAGADYVENLLRAAVASGVVCGWYARPILSDDGVPLVAQRAAATLMETAVTQALTRADSPSH